MAKNSRIKNDEEEARHSVAVAAQDAVKVVEIAKAEALKVLNVQNTDFSIQITRIETKLDRVISDVNKIESNTVGRIDKIEIDYVTKAEHEKIIDKMDIFNGWQKWITGGLAIITIFLMPLIFLVLTHLGEDSGNKATMVQIQKDHATFESQLQALSTKVK